MIQIQFETLPDCVKGYDYGHIIKKWRFEHQIRIDQFANMMHTTPDTIAEIENNLVTLFPDDAFIFQFYKISGIDLADA